MTKMSTQRLKSMKSEKIKISMVTAYDYPTACLLDQAKIDIALVGDSLAMTVLGLESTVSCTMEQMLHHIRPVVKGAQNALVVGDLPFGSYNVSKEESIKNAIRFMKEGGCDSVKLEGGREMADTVKAIVDAGIPVMAHIGLTPQTVSKLGGFKVQGKDLEAAENLLKDALALQEAGAWGLVLECIPEAVAGWITSKLDIPTVGIGGGRYCDGQVLVFHDMFGLFEKFMPKFAKKYLDLAPELVKGLETFKEEVQKGQFPEEKHVFKGPEEADLEKLY